MGYYKPVRKDAHSGRGGYRKGSGRKKILEGMRTQTIYVDEKSIGIIKGLGGGNLSKGFREAAKIIEQLDNSNNESDELSQVS